MGKLEEKISIVTGTLNRKKLLPRLIHNTVNACHDLELVLVDGGSRDGTQKWLKQLKHPRVKLVEVGARSYYWDYMNKGVRAAKYDIIGQWNDDILLESSWEEVFKEIDDSDAYIFNWHKLGDKSYKIEQGVMNYGLYHKHVFRNIGLYNPQYKWYYCDGDMSQRAACFKKKVKYCPNIKIVSLRPERRAKHKLGDKKIYQRNLKAYRIGALPQGLEYLE